MGLSVATVDRVLNNRGMDEFRDYGLDVHMVRTERYDPEKQRSALMQLIESK